MGTTHFQPLLCHVKWVENGLLQVVSAVRENPSDYSHTPRKSCSRNPSTGHWTGEGPTLGRGPWAPKFPGLKSSSLRCDVNYPVPETHPWVGAGFCGPFSMLVRPDDIWTVEMRLRATWNCLKPPLITAIPQFPDRRPQISKHLRRHPDTIELVASREAPQCRSGSSRLRKLQSSACIHT